MTSTWPGRDTLVMETVMSKEFAFIPKALHLIMLFFPLTSFLLIPSIQGTTVATVLSSMLFGIVLFLPLGDVKVSILKELVAFFAVVFVLSCCSQLANLGSGLKLGEELVLINRADYLDTFYRTSHITQTLYLIVGFLIYLLVKYFAEPTTIQYMYWGLRLLCFYALYEFFYYILTGQNGAVMSNRTFAYNERSASLFQTVNLGGMHFLRLKGYTGEPSMFTFSVMPYWILAVGLKRRFDIGLLLLCLLLTFSTTSYFMIFAFACFWFLYKRQYKIFIAAGIAVVILGVALQMEPFSDLFKGVYDFVFADKFGDEAVSSRDRGSNLQTHIIYWAGLDFYHQLVGIGFGYIRSTDFFSTLFLNTGLIGFLVFTWFVFRNFQRRIGPADLNVCYKGGLVAVYFIMMATVPEFAYPSLWIYLSIGYTLETLKTKEFLKT